MSFTSARPDHRLYSQLGHEESVTIMPETEAPRRSSEAFETLTRIRSKSSDSKLAQFADRGTGWYQSERDRHNLPSLVQTGRHAGRSRVHIVETNHLKWHTWKRDFFTSLLQLPLVRLFGLICAVEMATWTFWALVWYCYHHFTGRVCMTGFDSASAVRSAVSAFLFSIETQQTIGYGARVPKDCLGSMVILVMQCLTQLLLEAFCVGLVFARLSHPKNRGRSIFMSESAVICRRDGALKLMFRVGDVRATQVIDPKITALLYMFGERTTAEGERIILRVEPLKVSYADHMLLLPVTIEHTIDYTSPLYGHTHDSLMDAHAEIVTTLEGSTETGSTFSARQSYLPNEIHWGHTFVSIIRPAVPPSTHHTVAMSKFHEVEPLPGLGMMNASQLSRHVLQHQRGVVPYPALGETTLCLSDDLVVCPRGSRNFLMARIGDTYFRDTVNVTVKVYLYQWKQRITPQGEVLPFKMKQLDIKSEENGETAKQLEVLLSMPQLVLHELSSGSPLASWTSEAAMFKADSDSEIVVQVSGTKAATGLPTVQKRTYTVLSEVKWGRHFHVMVSPPSRMGRKPVVDWRLFHATLQNTASGDVKPSFSRRQSSIDGRSALSESRTDSFGDATPSKNLQAKPAIYGSAWAEKDTEDADSRPTTKLSLALGGLQPATESRKGGPSSRFDLRDSHVLRAVNPVEQRAPMEQSSSTGGQTIPSLDSTTRSSSLEGPIPSANSPTVSATLVRKALHGQSSLSPASTSHSRPLEAAAEFSKSCSNLLSARSLGLPGHDAIEHHPAWSELTAPLPVPGHEHPGGHSSASNAPSPSPTDQRRHDDWSAKRSLYSISFDVDDGGNVGGAADGSDATTAATADPRHAAC